MKWTILPALAGALALSGCVAAALVGGATKTSGGGTGQTDLSSIATEKATSTAIDKGTSAAFDAATEGGPSAACDEVKALPIRDTDVRQAYELLSAANLRQGASETAEAFQARLDKAVADLRASLKTAQGNGYVVFRSPIPDSGVEYDQAAGKLSISATRPSGVHDLARQPLAASSSDPALAAYWSLVPTETVPAGATTGERTTYAVAFGRDAAAQVPWPSSGFHASIQATPDVAQAARGHLFTAFYGSPVAPYAAESADPADAASHRRFVAVKLECALVFNDLDRQVLLAINTSSQ